VDIIPITLGHYSFAVSYLVPISMSKTDPERIVYVIVLAYSKVRVAKDRPRRVIDLIAAPLDEVIIIDICWGITYLVLSPLGKIPAPVPDKSVVIPLHKRFALLTRVASSLHHGVKAILELIIASLHEVVTATAIE
jgi:hypothetical protein